MIPSPAAYITGNEANSAINDRPVPARIFGVVQNGHHVAFLEAQLVDVARFKPVFDSVTSG
jgi:hypothetical protein